jgi:hypothetical protein
VLIIVGLATSCILTKRVGKCYILFLGLNSDSEYSLVFCNSGIQIYQGIRKVFMVICAICMCANATIVTDIFVGSVSLAIVVYLV